MCVCVCMYVHCCIKCTHSNNIMYSIIYMQYNTAQYYEYYNIIYIL